MIKIKNINVENFEIGGESSFKASITASDETPNSNFGIVNSNEEYVGISDEYKVDNDTEEISFIDLAIINSYLYDCFKGNQEDLTVSEYGTVDNIGRIYLNGAFNNTNSFWFRCKFKDDENNYLIQTKIFMDHQNALVSQLHISCQKNKTSNEFTDFIKMVKSLSFNNSEYKGKCIKIKLREGEFRGIEIIDIEESSNELILTDTQKKYVEHFISRVKRGKSARYLLNGEPGTGKTESIRDIARKLIPHVTFIIPDFGTSEELSSIMEACEIFDNSVIVMDDIDLYLGSRDNGSYTRLLGQFLSFFDGVKKRKISLIASTNDKGLVDKAAERPGRFNLTLDYTFLDDAQIEKVCCIHLPERWRLKEVYDVLKGRINGVDINITGAFIANLADNIKEMSEDDENWGIEDTINLIKESYKGFYSSQVEKEKSTMGF